MSLYLDHNATSPASAEHIQRVVARCTSVSANPSSPHAAGRAASVALMDARKIVAQSVSVDPSEVIFVSGGSEANNLATRGVLQRLMHQNAKPSHAITSSIEHPSVLEPLQFLRDHHGLELTILPVDSDGRISLFDLVNAIQPNTELISIMAANNETGAIQPMRKFADWLHAARWTKIKPGQQWRAAQQEPWPHWAQELDPQISQEQLQKMNLHVDAVQAYGKIPFSHWWSPGYDLASFCAHKIGGMTGVGTLILRRGRQFQPLILGGAQERSRRAGTENLLGILSMAEVSQRLQDPLWWEELEVLARRRDLLRAQLKLIPEIQLNSPAENVLPNTLNFSVDGDRFRSEDVLIAMDMRGLYASSGSACSSSANRPSHVLMAQSGNALRARNAVRISLAPSASEQDIALISSTLLEIFGKS